MSTCIRGLFVPFLMLAFFGVSYAEVSPVVTPIVRATRPSPLAVAQQRKALSDFDRIKSFAGRWEGTSEWQGHTQKTVVEYRVTSHGSAVEQTSFAGMPHEMISVFYENQDGKVGLTHFCILGNHPTLELTHSGPDGMIFEYRPCAGGAEADQEHLQTLKLSFPGDGSMTEEHIAYKDGKPADRTFVTLRRL